MCAAGVAKGPVKGWRHTMLVWNQWTQCACGQIRLALECVQHAGGGCRKMKICWSVLWRDRNKPNCVSGIFWILNSICSLLGLYAPKLASIWIHRYRIWSLPIWGHVLILLWRAGHFLPRILPDHPLHQYEIFLYYKILISKEYNCNKNERKRLSGWRFMRIWAISPWKLPY